VGVKESIATVPLVVFCYDAVFVAGGWQAAWKARRAYYGALAATWVPLAWLVLRNGSRGGSAGFDVGVGAAHYWLTQGVAVLHYLKLCFWPHPLVFLSAPLERVTSLGPILAAAGVLAGLVVSLVGLWRRRPWGFLGTVFFVLLAPTSLIPGTLQEIAEHRMYLPLACVVVAVVATAGRRWIWPIAALALPLIVVARERNRDYDSALNLWAATVRDSPRSAQAEASYAAALQAAGQPAEASEHYQRALELAPPDQRHCDLGLAWEQAGRPDSALEEFRQALAVHPRMGFAELGVGRALAAQGRLPEAERALREGLEDSPQVGTDAAVGHYILGQLLKAQGRIAEAEAETAKALAIDPALGQAPASSR
jgi:Flp pilus assembly protein TadD